MEFSEKLRAVIGTATIDEFAAVLDEPAQRVKDVLRGKQKPPADLLIKLQLVMGVDLSWLLSDEKGPPKLLLNAREVALIDNYRAAEDAGRRAIEATGLAVSKHEIKGKVKKSA